MDCGQYIVEVTGISPKATEKDVSDFFAFVGAIDHIEIVRSGGNPCTAYVTFKNGYSMDTAVLLSGATLLDQRICITPWGLSGYEYHSWACDSHANGDERISSIMGAGQAVAMVKTMIAKGYELSTTALAKATQFDESHQVSATAARKVADVSQKIGLTDKVYAGYETVKSMDVYSLGTSAAAATGRTAAAAANAVLESSYFSKGALWASDTLARAAKAAADLGNRGATPQ